MLQLTQQYLLLEISALAVNPTCLKLYEESWTSNLYPKILQDDNKGIDGRRKPYTQKSVHIEQADIISLVRGRYPPPFCFTYLNLMQS